MSAANCPCGSRKKFDECCEPFLKGTSFPETAEQLMRSRYTAFALADIKYIKNTLAPESREDFDVKGTTKWAQDSKWKGLTIISTKKGGPDDRVGTVEFTAVYEQEGQGVEHHEVSEFARNMDGRWQFVDGDSHTHKVGEGHQHDGPKQQPVVRQLPKVGRNDSCPCGSGKKYKKCCEGT